MKKLSGIVGCILLFIIFTSFHLKNSSPSSYYIVSDKMEAGDRKTPEGLYTLVSKRIDKRWDRFLALDYPTQADYSKFVYRKQHGLIPQGAKIGAGIGIHGVWPHEDYTIDQYQNWTEGCISMKNKDVEELYSLVPVGTKVFIRK